MLNHIRKKHFKRKLFLAVMTKYGIVKDVFGKKEVYCHPLSSFKSTLYVARLFAWKCWVEKILQRTAGEVVSTLSVGIEL